MNFAVPLLYPRYKHDASVSVQNSCLGVLVLLPQGRQMCTVISKGCNCRYSGMHLYKSVKFIILDVKTSLLSPRSAYMPKQLHLNHIFMFFYFDQILQVYNPVSCYADNCIVLI